MPHLSCQSKPSFQDLTLCDNRSEILVEKQGTPSMSTDIEAKNSVLYEGKENQLKLSRGYASTWLCNFDMTNYPFDTQVCFMVLSNLSPLDSFRNVR